MKNIVKKLEEQGIIVNGMYISAFASKNPGEFIVKTDDGKVGMVKDNIGTLIVARHQKIVKDVNGNYICYGIENGKVFCEMYDKNLMHIGFEIIA